MATIDPDSWSIIPTSPTNTATLPPVDTSISTNIDDFWHGIGTSTRKKNTDEISPIIWEYFDE